MPIWAYPFARLRFRTFRQALLCTAPFILSGEFLFLAGFLADPSLPQSTNWLTTGTLGEMFGAIFLASIAWLFAAAGITEKALANNEESAFGIRIRSGSSRADQIARGAILVLSGSVFLIVYAYVSATMRTGGLGAHIFLGAAFATFSSMSAFYNAAVIVWVLSGFRVCP